MAPLTTTSSVETGAGGLGVPIARWALLFAWAVSVAQGAVAGRLSADADAVVFGAASVLTLIAVILVTDRHAAPLDVTGSTVAAGSAVAAAGLRLATDPEVQPWSVDVSAYVAAALIARGNYIAGVVGGALIAAASAGIALARTGSPAAAFAAVALPGVALLIGILWRAGIGVVVRAERRHRTAQARGEIALEASLAAAAEYAAQLRSIRDEAAPLLHRIARGDSLSADELVEVRVQEGAIRDQLRSPRVRDDALAAAIADARRRGVRVSMLWLEGPGAAPHPELLHRIAAIVADTAEGTLTIRAADGAGGVTVVRSGEGGSRTVLELDGTVRAVH